MVREPRLVERGTKEGAEHGLGAGGSISRPARVRPLLRQEADFFCETRWYREVMTLALGFPRTGFYLPAANKCKM